LSFLYFILLIGVLIFFHELGHFLAAKLFGVKVLKFALGFGKKLVSFQKGETEYAINLFPLGGYVKMLGQEPAELRTEEPLPPEDLPRAFDSKPRWQRAIVMLAGPTFNLALPLPLFFLLFSLVGELPPATVGSVMPDGPAWRAGSQPGDRIVEIDGEPIRYWEEMEARVSEAPGRELRLKIARDAELLELRITPQPTPRPHRLAALSKTVGLIGVTQAFLGSQVGVGDPEGIAGVAGLRSWDLVVAAGGQPVTRWVELQQAFARPAGQPLELTVRRTETVTALPPDPAARAPLGEAHQFTVLVPPAGTPESVGLWPGELVVHQVEPEGAAAKAGLQPGDELLEVDGKRCVTFELCLRPFREAYEQAHAVRFLRPGERTGPRVVSFAPQIRKELNEVKQEEVHAAIGFANRPFFVVADLVPNEDRLLRASVRAVTEGWNMIWLNAVGLAALATCQISAKNVGGPIMIFDLAGQAAKRGWEDFVWLLAIISINLGLINLLPIPILDGGQIVVLGVETLKRGPLSLRSRMIVAYVGLAMVVFLMVFAFKNDIERYWDDLVGFFR